MPCQNLKSTPTYLRQGSCLMVFNTPEAVRKAYGECARAFLGDCMFTGYKIRPPISPLPDYLLGSQPDKPWLVAEHGCIIFGITALPAISAVYPGLKEVLILNDPPIPAGNHARFYGLYSLRAARVKFGDETAESAVSPHAAGFIQYPLRAVA